MNLFLCSIGSYDNKRHYKLKWNAYSRPGSIFSLLFVIGKRDRILAREIPAGLCLFPFYFRGGGSYILHRKLLDLLVDGSELPEAGMVINITIDEAFTQDATGNMLRSR